MTPICFSIFTNYVPNTIFIWQGNKVIVKTKKRMTYRRTRKTLKPSETSVSFLTPVTSIAMVTFVTTRSLGTLKISVMKCKILDWGEKNPNNPTSKSPLLLLGTAISFSRQEEDNAEAAPRTCTFFTKE